MTPTPATTTTTAGGPMRGLWLWLYGPRNLWGSIAGLAGVAMMFAGVIGPGWLAIVAGLYAIGALAAPRPRTPDVSIAQDEGPEAIERRLIEIEEGMKAAAGVPVQEMLASIRGHAQTLLPKLDTPAVSPEDLIAVQDILLRDLPATLGNYLKLPSLYRRYHSVRDGKSAEELLCDQLRLLDGQLQAILEHVFRTDAEDLVAQGEKLEARFPRAGSRAAAVRSD